jgi:hypothetical protein
VDPVSNAIDQAVDRDDAPEGLPCPRWCDGQHERVRQGDVTARRHEGVLRLACAEVVLRAEDYVLPGQPPLRGGVMALIDGVAVSLREAELLVAALRAAEPEVTR